MRFVKSAFVFLLVIVAAAGIVIFTQMDTLIKAAIEEVGPRMTQTSVTVGSVHVSPFSGTGRIHKLVIGNPKGFETESALKLTDVRISLVPKSLTAQKMVVRKLIVEGPEITYEMTRTGSNLQALQKNVASFIPPAKSASKPEATAAKNTEKKIEIDLFILRGAKVHVRSHVIGNQELDVPLPEITLKDIGKGPQGATVQEATSAILASITRGVVHAVTDSGVLKNVNQSLKSAQGTLQKTFKGIFGR